MLTVAEARKFQYTHLDDTSLQSVIDRATSEVEEMVGGSTSSSIAPLRSRSKFLYLTFPILAVAKISSVYIDDVNVTKTYVEGGVTKQRFKLTGSNKISRLDGGYFTPNTRLTYTPAVDTALKEGAIVDLVKLYVKYSAERYSRIGDVSKDQKDLHHERAMILGRLPKTKWI